MKRSFWFLVGSQTLYGDDVLRTVDARAREMVAEIMNLDDGAHFLSAGNGREIAARLGLEITPKKAVAQRKIRKLEAGL